MADITFWHNVNGFGTLSMADVTFWHNDNGYDTLSMADTDFWHTVNNSQLSDTLSVRHSFLNNNNGNNGHLYGTKRCRKCIHTNNGQNNKVLGHTIARSLKNICTAISVNKPKLSETKLWSESIYLSRYTANKKCTVGYCTHTHTHTHTLFLSHTVNTVTV